MPFSEFLGNASIIQAVKRMLAQDRLPHTILFAGPGGVGKATLARMLAAAVNCTEAEADFCGTCSSCRKILSADLSAPEFVAQIAEREKLPAAKRNENPLVVSTHPDFLIFPPDGPLRILTIEQARLLRKAAQFAPSQGRRRVFVIDHLDRANVEAANSLLKTLEEPGPKLTLILTAENAFDLLPTIRSRATPFYFSPLGSAEMTRFFERREDISPEDRSRLAAWSQGSPGDALAIDVEEFLGRREVMLTLLETALGSTSFSDLAGRMEGIARRTKERLDVLIRMLQTLLADLLHLHIGRSDLMHADLRERLRELADRASFAWIEQAAAGLDELEALQRRNIQKQIALEAYALRQRRQAQAG